MKKSGPGLHVGHGSWSLWSTCVLWNWGFVIVFLETFCGEVLWNDRVSGFKGGPVSVEPIQKLCPHSWFLVVICAIWTPAGLPHVSSFLFFYEQDFDVKRRVSGLGTSGSHPCLSRWAGSVGVFWPRRPSECTGAVCSWDKSLFP